MEENNNIRLIDEALKQEPIKNTFRLAWEFISVNRTFTLTALSILLLLNLLNPILGLLAMVLSGIFSMAIQIYVARLYYKSQDIQSYIAEIEKHKLENVIKENALTASGAYTAWMALILGLVLILTLLAANMGVSMDNVNDEIALFQLIITLGFPLLVILLLFSYVQPLVQANVAFATDYKEGFFAVLTIFSKEVWKQAFQNSYFKYISIVGVIIMFLGLLVGVLISIPFISLIAPFIIVVLMYIYMVIMAVASMMAKRLVE